MTHTQLYKVEGTRLIIDLPSAFKDKEVQVTIDDNTLTLKSKLELMQLAANDILFLSDMNAVNDDFEGIDHEAL